MYRLVIEDSISSAHFIDGYQGKCSEVHGHNWKVIITVKGKWLDKLNILVDYGILKKLLKDLLESLDHKFLNKELNEPHITSEFLAKYIYQKYKKLLAVSIKQVGSVTLDKVGIGETDKVLCEYWED